MSSTTKLDCLFCGFVELIKGVDLEAGLPDESVKQKKALETILVKIIIG